MKKTALVADDHEIFRVHLGAILRERLGFGRVETADSLESVTEALGRTANVDLILIDLNMPGMEGAASLAAIRNLRPEAHLAVVSGSLDRNDMLSAMASGVHGYVPKALPIPEMTDALSRIAAGQVYLPPSFAAVPAPGAVPPVPAPQPRPAPAAAAPQPGAGLTPRQRDVLELLKQGRTNREIAVAMELAEGTVKSHLAALFKALGVRNRSEAAVAAAMMSAS